MTKADSDIYLFIYLFLSDNQMHCAFRGCLKVLMSRKMDHPFEEASKYGIAGFQIVCFNAYLCGNHHLRTPKTKKKMYLYFLVVKSLTYYKYNSSLFFSVKPAKRACLLCKTGTRKLYT